MLSAQKYSSRSGYLYIAQIFCFYECIELFQVHHSPPPLFENLTLGIRSNAHNGIALSVKYTANPIRLKNAMCISDAARYFITHLPFVLVLLLR